MSVKVKRILRTKGRCTALKCAKKYKFNLVKGETKGLYHVYIIKVYNSYFGFSDTFSRKTWSFFGLI